MLRGRTQASAQDKQQKQKKRLSFKDPEIEGPLSNYLYPTGNKSKILAKPTKATNSSKGSASVENLTLEDRALQIAQNVGCAFSDTSITDSEKAEFIPVDIESQKETEIRGSSPTEFAAYHRNCQVRSFKISAEDEEFLDALVPPLLDLAMRCPSIESSGPNSPKNSIPATDSSPIERRPSSSTTQHQIQMLRYQLEQQNQQTQSALHQAQLLQDQLNAENVARRKAQEQNNQLMHQNQELLNHMEKLFQQIEDMEKQIQVMEQEKRSKSVITSPERQVASLKQPSSYTLPRRPTTEQGNERPTLQNRSQYAAPKKSSFSATKPSVATSKISPTQNTTSVPASRKTPSIATRPLSAQTKNKDTGAKEKETLRIGDTSPPVQSSTVSAFASAWRMKSSESSIQSSTDKAAGSAVRSRTGSFSSFVRKPQESAASKSTLFSSNSNSFSSTSVTGKKYSSSTSDLYNAPSAFQGKSSLMIEEPSSGVKSAVSNLSISTISKLPRYQPYTGWQRRTSLSGEGEQVSTINKDSYKSSPQTSLFNR